MPEKLRRGFATAVITAVIVTAGVGLALVFGDGGDATGDAGGKYRQVEFATAGEMLAAHAGTPMVVNFFASWCAPCRAELPDLAEAHNRYGDDVKFIGINHADFSPEATSELLIETGITYDIVKDPEGRFLQELGRLPTMPTTVFVDAAGNVTERHHGIILADQIAANIKGLLP
jgi:thiol-disulfide isomerase/thioredoxin